MKNKQACAWSVWPNDCLKPHSIHLLSPNSLILRLTMAPKGRGTKRAASEAVIDEVKKMKETFRNYGVSKSWYDGVVDGLQSPAAEDPLSVRQMLIAMLPEGLCVPQDQRHAYQATNVNMVSETLQKIMKKLEENVAEAGKEVCRIEETKEQLQQKVQTETDSLEKALESEKSCKEILAVATRSVLTQKKALSEAEKTQEEKDSKHQQAIQEKAKVETALAEEFRLLRDGEVEGEVAQAHYAKLEALAGAIGFEASLLTALPTSILKPPGSRGSFDVMVVQQLQEGLTKHCACLAEEIQKNADGVRARAEAVEEAKKELQLALEQQQAAAEKYKSAQELPRQLQKAKLLAEAEVAACDPALKKAMELRTEAETQLENFQNYNWACFEKLRDHRAAKAAEAAEAAEAQIAEAGA